MANINSGIHKQLSTISLLIQLGIKSVRFYLRCELLDTESQVISILAKGSGDLPPPPTPTKVIFLLGWSFFDFILQYSIVRMHLNLTIVR